MLALNHVKFCLLCGLFGFSSEVMFVIADIYASSFFAQEVVLEVRLYRCDGGGENPVSILVMHNRRRIAARSPSCLPDLITVEVIHRRDRCCDSQLPDSSN